MSFIERLVLRLFLAVSVVILARAQSVYTTPYTFGTFAGTSSTGSADGVGLAARFYGPCGVAVDATGNVLLVDSSNHTIRKITPTGSVTTLAGKAGLSGSADGAGSAARFSRPYGLAMDSVGNVYVSDRDNHTIRKVTPSGVVTTFAGQAGVSGAVDGQGSSARFNIPADLAIDAAGNLVVCDIGNYTIRLITPAGVVSTLAGDAGVPGTDDGGTSLKARFNLPFGIAVDAAGNTFLFDRFLSPTTTHTTYLLRKITPAGQVSTVKSYVIANAPDLRDVDAQAVRGLTFDAAGNRFETQGGEIHRVAPDGTVTTVAGKQLRGFADGTAANATFERPGFIACDRLDNLYVTDAGNNNVRKVTANGDVSTLAGLARASTFGSTDATGSDARFGFPTGVAVAASGDVYVADHDNYTIRKITPAGVVTTLAGSPGQSGTADGTGSAARFLSPSGIAVDATNNVYVGEVNGAVRKITAAGVVTTLTQLSSPQGLAVDATGQVYVADTYAHTIHRISTTGSVTLFAGKVFSPGHVDGTGDAARFRYPRGLAVDAAGNVYVADTNNHSIRKITPAGLVTTLAGGLADGATAGSADGPGATATFTFPGSVAVDAAGNLLVADTWNQTIRRITPSGEVSTIAGFEDSPGHAEGTGSEARFYYPQAVALNAANEVYVASSTTIRKGVAAGRPVITTQPQSVTAAVGATVQLSVSVAADPAPTYQWSANGTALAGATSATLTIVNAQVASSGSYTVTATNSLGSVTSSAAIVTVTTGTPPPVTPPAGDSQGGGGAPSVWFVAAMLSLGGVRWFANQRGLTSRRNV